ncbi:MAG: archaeal heat shock protein Hsp20 [Nitrososphaerales archaeon]
MTWDDWFRKRMRPFLGPWYYEMEEMMKEMEKMFGESMKEFEAKVPKELVRERKLGDGTTRKEWGPFVYGYSVTIGPDGEPVIREFGNVKPSLAPGSRFALKDEREPLVDVMSSADEIKVIVELPGVKKEDIKVSATENNVVIQADTSERKYRKETELPDEVDPASAKSTYKNGILEITFKRKGKKPSGVSIEVE